MSRYKRMLFEPNVMVNREELIGTTDHLTL